MKKNLSVPNNMVAYSNQSSLANKYGVTCKENCSIGSMGLNPNLNMEDQYIENLLKQIHFMNMEIKLVKQKQKMSGSNALWSLVNRSKQPMMTNITNSTNKYQGYKHQTAKQISHLEHMITNMDNSHHSLLSEMSLLQNRDNLLNLSIKSKFEQTQQKTKNYQQVINENTIKFNELTKQKNIQETKKNQLFSLLTSLEKQSEKDRYTKERQAIAIQHQQQIEQKIQVDLDDKISKLNININTLKKLFEGNSEYIKAREEKQTLEERVVNLDKNIMGIKFELLQLDQSLKMAQLEKDKEIRERKKITESLQQNKMILFSILTMNISRKGKQSQNRLKQSPEIKKAKEQEFKLKKNLEDVKNKLKKSSDIQNSIHSQVHNLSLELTNIKKSHQQLNTSLSSLLKRNNQKESKSMELQSQVQQFQQIYKNNQQQYTFLIKQQLGLLREVQYLKKKSQKLRERVCDLPQLINELKVEDLSRVVKKNEDFNSTVATVMSKWTEIKEFGRI